MAKINHTADINIKEIGSPINVSIINDGKKKQNNNWQFFFTALLTIVGWLIGSYLTSIRDRENKLRDVTLQYKLEAYNEYAAAFTNPSGSIEKAKHLQSSFSIIQILGTHEEIDTLQAIMKKIHYRESVNFKGLTNLLKQDIRSQLKLDYDTSEIMLISADSVHPSY